MVDNRPSQESGHDFRRETSLDEERDRLTVDLQVRVKRLDKQARIFIPLIALWLITTMPVWSKSLPRFLLLLSSPFVFLPVGFCIIHIVLAWRGVERAKNRIRDWERLTQESRQFER